MNSLHGRYVNYLNRIHGRVGQGFGSRFQNKIVDANNYGLWLSHYIHRQPVEAGLVASPEDYKWSSYQIYIGQAQSDFLKPGIILKQFGNVPSEQRLRYRKFVNDIDNGPVDWKAVGRQSGVIIGEELFKKQVLSKLKHCKVGDKTSEGKLRDPLMIICDDLKLNKEKLLKPFGWEERRLRHRAFSMLVEKYHFPMSVIARAFGVSPAAVIKAIRYKK